MSTKLLKREHRLDAALIAPWSLRTWSRFVAVKYPRTEVGRAALEWLRRKCRACAANIERQIGESLAQEQRVIDRCFGDCGVDHG